MKRFGNVVSALVVGATVALITSLLAVLFVNDIGIMLYLAAMALVGVALVGVSIGIGLLWRRHVKACGIALIAAAAFFTVTTLVTLNGYRFRSSLLWLVWSHRYKTEVLANSAQNGEFKHTEWDGDGWGSAATGDWMSYVVFDPSDSLSKATKKDVPTNYGGIPCTVVKVRLLEKQWYSVVTDMNQFWDNIHPGCGPLITHRQVSQH